MLNLIWKNKHYNKLELDELYEILKLRSKVFVVEQNCVYQDIDEKDRHPEAMHLMGYTESGLLAVYLRILPAGLSYDEVSIGRIVSAPKMRGQGCGEPLVNKALQIIEQYWPNSAVKIGAQEYLGNFYQKFRFKAVSESYLEDGIPHIDMLRNPDKV